MVEKCRTISISLIIRGLLAAIFLLLAGMAVMSYSYVRSYTVFTAVEKVANVVCRQEKSTGERVLSVTFASGPLQGKTLTIPFYGDEWVFEGRVVKWKNFAGFFGIKRYYCYERVTGRYLDAEQERAAMRTVYPLAEQPDKMWPFFYRYQRFIPFIDAAYGNSAFVSFRSDAIFEVCITPTGFMIRDITEPKTRPWWSVG